MVKCISTRELIHCPLLAKMPKSHCLFFPSIEFRPFSYGEKVYLYPAFVAIALVSTVFYLIKFAQQSYACWKISQEMQALKQETLANLNKILDSLNFFAENRELIDPSSIPTGETTTRASTFLDSINDRKSETSSLLFDIINKDEFLLESRSTKSKQETRQEILSNLLWYCLPCSIGTGYTTLKKFKTENPSWVNKDIPYKPTITSPFYFVSELNDKEITDKIKDLEQAIKDTSTNIETQQKQHALLLDFYKLATKVQTFSLEIHSIALLRQQIAKASIRYGFLSSLCMLIPLFGPNLAVFLRSQVQAKIMPLVDKYNSKIKSFTNEEKHIYLKDEMRYPILAQLFRSAVAV